MISIRGVVSFTCGIVFALGLGISGMTRPEKIQGYLDFFGNWDPTLLFVMATGVGTFALAHVLARRSARPLCDVAYHWPSRLGVDAKTLAGSAIFGVGWAISGFCPGPAITSLATLQANVFVFVGGLVAGVLAFFALSARGPARAGRSAAAAVSADAP